jgi:aspartyl aminopeptidase
MSAIARLCTFLDASPTPIHAVATLHGALTNAGFVDIDPSSAPQQLPAGFRGILRKSGTLIAFVVGNKPVAEAGFRIIAAHTDSPNLKIKPNPVVRGHGWVRLGVEVYGGAIVPSWADRDLGIAGTVVIADGAGRRTEPLLVREPVCHIPTVAIHLNRTVNDEGLKLNKQTQLPAVFALADEDDAQPFKTWLAKRLDCAAEDLLAWDLSLFDLTPATIGGANGEFLFSARLDNLASCHAGLEALLASEAADTTQVLACFDHEEIGSRTSRGANGRTLESLLRHIADNAPHSAEGGLDRALTHTILLSADMAHAVHPAYADKHDAEHMPRVNAGPVIKSHANQHYATEGDTAAMFKQLCHADDAPWQWFVVRSDMRCGSTVGPMLSASLGVRGLDVGNPMLSMHSAREMCGTRDHGWLIGAMTRFLG